jgi:uncharacterized membrane protein YcaP (DUF421 family)
MEIVYRAVIVFLFLWIITRVVGRSTIGELSTFQLLLFVTMGDLVQQAVMQQDYSLTGGVLAISVFAVMTIAISWVTVRWPRLRWLTHGVPVLIVKDGVPIDRALRRERLTFDDLHAAARQQGFERLGDIRLAILEANGSISFFAQDPGEDERAGAEDKPAIA